MSTPPVSLLRSLFPCLVASYCLFFAKLFIILIIPLCRSEIWCFCSYACLHAYVAKKNGEGEREKKKKRSEHNKQSEMSTLSANKLNDLSLTNLLALGISWKKQAGKGQIPSVDFKRMGCFFLQTFVLFVKRTRNYKSAADAIFFFFRVTRDVRCVSRWMNSSTSLLDRLFQSIETEDYFTYLPSIIHRNE